MFEPDPDYDPCAAFIRLRAAYQSVLLGETVRSTRFRNGEEEREVDFSPSNIGELRKAMIQARDECQAKSTGATGRRAIGIGRRTVRSIY